MSHSSSVRACCAVFVLLIAAPRQAAADTVYSNLGPADSFDTTTGWTVGAVSTNSYDLAADFTTPSTAYNLDSALFPEYGAGCTQVGLAATEHRSEAASGPLHAVNEDSPLLLHLGDVLRRVVQVREP